MQRSNLVTIVMKRPFVERMRFHDHKIGRILASIVFLDCQPYMAIIKIQYLRFNDQHDLLINFRAYGNTHAEL
jgi:hypothetical protein